MIPIFVANWKMMMSRTKALTFCNDNRAAFAELSQSSQLVICPSFPMLASLVKIFEKTKIAIGAQNCSQYKEGAYTGDVSSKMLAEIGCRYCIVGHSERRYYFGETNKEIAEKIKQLFACNIQPIVCVGETKQEYENKKTLQVLAQQLDPICQIMNRENPIIIAYEPVWSIGTGIIPDQYYLSTIFSWLFDYMQQIPSHTLFLYGGSVNANNVALIKKIPHVSGFLIGSASTDFQKFEKIVLLGR
ncbi:MAG: triose-phosphate isomerase [Candidatus Babeliales bacterium]